MILGAVAAHSGDIRADYDRYVSTPAASGPFRVKPPYQDSGPGRSGADIRTSHLHQK
jgi:hypothetical protein